jgi:hypothetical protein
MPDQRPNAEEPPHDVLAAEEFALPAPDPAIHEDEVHDVLAAEEFVVPAPDPAIHHGPVALPEDLTGAAEPRDVLAAEEFAMPAGPPHPMGHMGGSAGGLGYWARRVAVVAVGVYALRRVLQRR